ncbi:sterol desaturase family protein [Marinicella sp. W31]|uniref:sterol desaturase family protein n=1 Tax=Marinicella sp. W31 TaxID=3023713 RepID=UPI003756EDA2
MRFSSKDYEYKERVTPDLSEKAFRIGEGRISGYVSMFLGISSFLAVLCYKFPSYLTTTDLRAVYDAEYLQTILMVTMWVSLGFGLLTFILNNKKRMGAVGILFTVFGFMLGGYQVPVGAVTPSPMALGLDWTILAFIASAILFIFLEKVFPKHREQVIARPEWSLDLSYFIFNHLLITALLLVGNHFFNSVFSWAISSDLQAFVQSLPLWAQVILLMVCADFVLYWSHRAYHEIPGLWKIHAIHHSVEYMDWLAGSRNHVIQTFSDRIIAIVPLYLIGADKAALDIYVAFAAFQAVYVHANVEIPTGFLKYIFVTPKFHHWHHSSQKPAIDTNYSVHLVLFDVLFRTYHMPKEHWPSHYGTVPRVPRSFWRQLVYPFRRGK